MKLNEKRGSSAQKLIDQRIGLVILLVLDGMLFLKRFFCRGKAIEKDVELLVCFGAFGDLIVLTEAAKKQKRSRTLYLACSKLNFSCAQMYRDFYAGIEVVDLRNPWSIYLICRRWGINKIYDSTQWANIGPIEVGIAKLLSSRITTVGFATSSSVRGYVYDRLVSHLRNVHELANFFNLLGEQEMIPSNLALAEFFPNLYSSKSLNKTRKILFHLWPSGNRSYLKEWPQEYWVELIRFCTDLGYAIYLSGAPSDKLRADALIEKYGLLEVINLAGVYDLKSLSDFVSNEVEFAVSVNTGILHLW